MNFKLRQLEGFVAAARSTSFSSAARQLAMTQPAFSQLIRELENVLSVRLFERTTRRIELTEVGQRLLGMVERPLEDLRDAEAHIRHVAAGRRGRIVFTALPSVAFGFATHALAKFKARYPAISVRLIEEQNLNIVQKVLDREVDFGIGTLSAPRPELEFRHLLEDELLAIVPARHRLSAKRRLSWKELAAEPLILLPPRASVTELAQVGFAANRLRLEPAYEVANMVTALRMVRSGFGVTLMPRIALAELNMKGLVSAKLSSPVPVRSIGVITHAERTLSPAAAACIELLVTEAAAARSRAR
ncbi:MAG TPA: LysR substrate-binding domain-containing protein [Burkholderiales bacterium]|nr:LysR substrate-binding domain-containing protein [Burkholderiales bacterium]